MLNDNPFSLLLKLIRDLRDVEKSINEIAKKHPKTILEYIQSLPKDWDKQSNRETDMFKRLRTLVLQELSGEVGCVMQQQNK